MIEVSRAELSDALAAVCQVAPQRSPRPILTNVLIEVGGDSAGMTLSATDREIDIAYQVQQVQTDLLTGVAVCVNANKFRAIIQELADEIVRLDFASDGESVTVHAGESRFVLNTPNVEDYPPIHSGKSGKDSFGITTEHWSHLVSHTLFAVSPNDSRYAITGACLQKAGSELRMICTDGRRLSRCRIQIAESSISEEVIIPKKAVALISRIAGSGEPIQVTLEANKIIVHLRSCVITSALVEGRFPDPDSVVPKDSTKTVTLDVHELTRAVRQAAILTNDDSNAVSFKFSNSQLTIHSHAVELGSGDVSIECDWVDDDFKISFQPSYITDMLKTLKSDTIELRLKNFDSAGYFVIGDDRACPAFEYVVMPVSH